MPYQAVGLNASDYQLAPMFADIISSCFIYMYTTAVSYSIHDDGMVNLECTKPEMFPSLFSSSDTRVPTPGDGRSALETCLDALCSPRTLDPDLSGIGVRLLTSQMQHEV